MWCKLWNSNSRQLFDVWQVDTIKYLLVVRRTTTRNTSPLTHGIWLFSWIVITPHTCELAIKWLKIITLQFSSQLFVICWILGRDGCPSTCANLIQVHNQFKLLQLVFPTNSPRAKLGERQRGKVLAFLLNRRFVGIQMTIFFVAHQLSQARKNFTTMRAHQSLTCMDTQMGV